MTVDYRCSWLDAKTYRSDKELKVSNLPHLFGDTEEFAAVVLETEEQIAKADKRWTWKDVASVFPVSDCWSGRPVLRPRSNVHRHEYIISASAEEVHRALIHAISEHELMRSMAVVSKRDRDFSASSSQNPPPTNTWYTVMRTDAPGLFEQRIKHIEVESLESGVDAMWTDDISDGARFQPPGPLVFFTILHSTDPSKCVLLYQIHHSIFDMSSLAIFLRDIDSALREGGKVERKQSSYGPYAYWRYTLPWTKIGKDNVDYNVNRLNDIAKAGNKAMWPEKRAQGWMRGNDHGHTIPGRKPLGPVGVEQMGIFGDEFTTDVKGINRLRSEHGLSPAKVVKAAQIIFNAWKTGVPEVVFVGAEGARMVPGAAPPTLDLRNVPGPAVEVSLTRFFVSCEESTLEFLNRVQQDQLNLSTHCHCHKGHISAALSEEDRQFVTELGGRQVFNWAPKVPLQHERIRLKKFEGRSDIGISWVFRMSTEPDEEEVLVVEYSWDNCQNSPSEVQLATKQLLAAAKWLTNPDNTHKSIRECNFDPCL